MRLAFMGSPDFAVPALKALCDAGHEVCCVYTQPPKPVGRGQKTACSPVHRVAQELGLTVRTPHRLRTDESEHAHFRDLELDAAVVAAYGLILPQEMLSAPRRGCLNIHASLLPRWRGAAPIQAAIIAGDAETGITIMQMDEGLDTGAMLCSAPIPIGPDATTSSLHDALAQLGSKLILDALATSPDPRPQPEQGATYASKLSKADGLLDWCLPADLLHRRIRALNPWPGTYFMHQGTMIRVTAALPGEMESGAAPGTVLDNLPRIACGSGTLTLLRLGRPGKAITEASAFVRGYNLQPGSVVS
ncbi:methionyl-tRNA formyltransferase [Pseudoroseomonas globiformis]|uniref:Methionyl-tRNA formyltransferase n=1 Tax=Teichococcus globiformis TaxID=2307229 RepID=A0ABV7G1P7_9PROT